jgi:hypothetical protein
VAYLGIGKDQSGATVIADRPSRALSPPAAEMISEMPASAVFVPKGSFFSGRAVNETPQSFEDLKHLNGLS